LASYLLPNWHPKNRGNLASAVIKRYENWKIAELRLPKKMICRCQIPIVAVFRALQPNSDRSAVPLETVLNQARVRAEIKTAIGLIAWFYQPFKHGAADGVTRLSGIIEREGRR